MAVSSQQLHALLYQHWQADSFRALQLEAITATLQGRDSLVILPTGTQLLWPSSFVLFNIKLVCALLCCRWWKVAHFSATLPHTHTWLHGGELMSCCSAGCRMQMSHITVIAVCTGACRLTNS